MKRAHTMEILAILAMVSIAGVFAEADVMAALEREHELSLVSVNVCGDR